MTPTFVSVTPSTNFVVDTNNTRRIGNLIVVYVKGHSTGSLPNGVMFSLDTTASVRNGSSTFPIGIGGEWSITETGYGFFNSESKAFATVNLTSGKYVHVHYVAIVA